MYRYIFNVFFCLVFLACSNQSNHSEWRGPNRMGIYYETGLLTNWPDSGPELLWSFESLGAGHSSVGIGNDMVYVNGMPDTLGVLYAFDLNGNLQWQKTYGPEWHINYTGARSTPVTVNDKVYLLSGMGVVYCFDGNTGNIIWQVDLIDKYQAENIRWGITETLLVDGEKLYCTPGGEKHNVIAINRFTGETIWTSEGFSEPSAYCSPVLVNHNNTKLILTMTASSAIGLDAETGQMYWRVEQNQGNKIHANSPLYNNGVVYFSSSSAKTNGGLLALKLSETGKEVTQLWRNESFKSLMGGIVMVNEKIYGSNYRSKEWYAINPADGSLTLLTDNFTNGVIVFADNHFYCYNEDGEMALVSVSDKDFPIRSKFTVLMGTKEHWAHPVIHNKRLYLRHGNALMVYDISKKS